MPMASALFAPEMSSLALRHHNVNIIERRAVSLGINPAAHNDTICIVNQPLVGQALNV